MDRRTASIVCRGEEIFVPRNIISKIGVFTDVQSPDDAFTPFDVDINPEVLKLIIEWLTHHADDKELYPIGVSESRDFLEDSLEPISGWDREFIDRMSPKMFYRFVPTVIDLEINSLTRMGTDLPKALQTEEYADILSIDA